MDHLTASKLQTAYELIKAEQRDQACEILIPLVCASPDLTDGWFLLGHAVSDSQEKTRCFQQVLRLDPANQPAQKQLDRLLASQPAPKKQNPALLWGLAGLFICLSGFGLLWSFSNPLFASPAPTVPGSANSTLPTVTLVASRSTPKPSSTPKPTSKPTVTMPPTPTAQPSVTMLPTLTETPDLTQTQTPKPKVFVGCLAPNGMSVQTAPFKVENFGKDKATVHIKGASRNGNYPISCQAIVKQGKPVLFTLMWGNYEYIVFRGGASIHGSFFINQPNKATMQIFKDKIRIGPFP
jgi:hypothetical protein